MVSDRMKKIIDDQKEKLLKKKKDLNADYELKKLDVVGAEVNIKEKDQEFKDAMEEVEAAKAEVAEAKQEISEIQKALSEVIREEGKQSKEGKKSDSGPAQLI